MLTKWLVGSYWLRLRVKGSNIRLAHSDPQPCCRKTGKSYPPWDTGGTLRGYICEIPRLRDCCVSNPGGDVFS